MKLSVIISNRNDTAMLAVTIRSCIEEFKAINDKCEIVIVDNSDDGEVEVVKSVIPQHYINEGVVKFIRQDFPCLFTARDTAVENASGEYVVCLDSHMLCGRDMLVDMVTYMDSLKWNDKVGFGHAPISWAHQHERASRHDRDMSQHELGAWGTRYKNVRKITWKGMPWICRREFFLSREKGIGGYGALAKHRVSWGGGDMHIGIKPWLLGYENYAFPTSPGIHIGPFPKVDIAKGTKETIVRKKGDDSYKYRVYSSSGNFPHTFGFLVSCYVLGGEAMMNRNKEALTNRFGRYIRVDKWWDKAIELGQEEKDWLDANKVMSFEELLIKKPWEN